MGLSAKNAILIVEFAEQTEKQGKAPLDAAYFLNYNGPTIDPDDE